MFLVGHSGLQVTLAIVWSHVRIPLLDLLKNYKEKLDRFALVRGALELEVMGGDSCLGGSEIES